MAPLSYIPDDDKNFIFQSLSHAGRLKLALMNIYSHIHFRSKVNGFRLLNALLHKDENTVLDFIRRRNLMYLDVQCRDGQTPLMVAVNKEYENVIIFLLNNGANPNIKSNDGLTVLHLACRMGKKRTVQCLLDAKADMSLVDKEHRTALQWAENYHHEEVIELLKSQQVSLGKPSKLVGPLSGWLSWT